MTSKDTASAYLSLWAISRMGFTRPGFIWSWRYGRSWRRRGRRRGCGYRLASPILETLEDLKDTMCLLGHR